MDARGFQSMQVMAIYNTTNIGKSVYPFDWGLTLN
jgi:hypothetical protein